MALQGNLRDFSATEILQLLGTQKKTGCLTLEREGQRMVIYVLEGRVVSTRSPGMSKDDPLLRFLLGTRRLSEEQCRGILTIQRESGRDFEDLLMNGRYLDADELASFVERQILDDLMHLPRWEDGSYRFDPHLRWMQTPLVRLSVEGVLVEIARRSDEEKRHNATFPDPNQILGVRDLPDPSVDLTDEERELFGIIDGRRSLTQVVEVAPLSAFETYEALQRMVEAGWLEGVGRLEPGRVPAPPVAAPAAPQPARHSWARELAVGMTVLVGVLLLRAASSFVVPQTHRSPAVDVFAEAQVREVRMALDLYRRERGVYPARLDDLLEARWITSGQTRIAGHSLRYRCERDGLDYRLELSPDR